MVGLSGPPIDMRSPMSHARISCAIQHDQDAIEQIKQGFPMLRCARGENSNMREQASARCSR